MSGTKDVEPGEDDGTLFVFSHMVLMNLVMQIDGEVTQDEVGVMYMHARTMGLDEDAFASMLDAVGKTMAESGDTVGEVCARAALTMKRVADSTADLEDAYRTYELIAFSDGLDEQEAILLGTIRELWGLPESLRGIGKGTQGVAKALMNHDLRERRSAEAGSSGCLALLLTCGSMLGALLLESASR